MIDSEYCYTLARYNTWMNTRLYAACEGLSDQQRKLDRGAFFGSIHNTLNHILFGDTAFMARFTGEPATVPELGEVLHDSFSALADARASLDKRINAWSQTLTHDWLTTTLTYCSKVDGVQRTLPRWLLVTHMFQHATHHRGQVSTLLNQLGMDIGTTDLPFMPEYSA